MKKSILSISFLLISFCLNTAYGQGCVAVRPMSCSASGNSGNLGILQKNQWQLGASYRYFKSFRHFRGDSEETERVEHETDVRNYAHSIDLGLSYGITNRISVSLNLPLIHYYRTSLYEHYGNSVTANPEQNRFHTAATGIGDLRLTGYYWIWNPERDSLNGNLAVGLGVKAPTGNSNVEDEFHKISKIDGSDSVSVRAVDQSIQLGDGGWAVNLELQGFLKVFKGGWLYFNGFYMSNPRNYNNTLTRGTLTNVDPMIAYHSVADQYAARLGLNYAILPHSGFSASLGGRIEGVPSKDIIGKSDGFRRPGYIFSVDPGLSYMYKTLTLVLNVPVALYRNRTKSTYDLADPTGTRHGDAAFADYLINFNVIWRFGKKQGSSAIPNLN